MPSSRGSIASSPWTSTSPAVPPGPSRSCGRCIDLQAKIQRGGSLAGTGLPELLEREKMITEKRTLPPGFALAGERGDEDRFGYRLPGGPGQLGRTRRNREEKIYPSVVSTDVLANPVWSASACLLGASNGGLKPTRRRGGARTTGPLVLHPFTQSTQRQGRIRNEEKNKGRDESTRSIRFPCSCSSLISSGVLQTLPDAGRT